MSKKNTGKMIACIIIVVLAVAGCLMYFYKFRDFQKSLDNEFDDFEDNFKENSDEDYDKDYDSASALERSYVSIPLESSESASK